MAHVDELLAHISAMGPWVDTLDISHSPDAFRDYDDHGHGIDSFAASSRFNYAGPTQRGGKMIEGRFDEFIVSGILSEAD